MKKEGEMSMSSEESVGRKSAAEVCAEVLGGMAGQELDGVVVVGLKREGDRLNYLVGNSDLAREQIVYALELAKLKFLTGAKDG